MHKTDVEQTQCFTRTPTNLTRIALLIIQIGVQGRTLKFWQVTQVQMTTAKLPPSSGIEIIFILAGETLSQLTTMTCI